MIITVFVLVCSIYGSECDGPIKFEVTTCGSAMFEAQVTIARTQLYDDKHYLKVSCGGRL